MSETETRTHVIMPTELLEKIDALVGPRKRSKFFVDLAQREIARLELLEAAQAVATTRDPAHLPEEWKSGESTANWVHNLRQEALERQDRLDHQRESTPEAP